MSQSGENNKVDRRTLRDGNEGWDTICRVDRGVKHLDRAKQLYRAGSAWIRKGQEMDKSVASQYTRRGRCLICNVVGLHDPNPTKEMFQIPTPNRKSAVSELYECYKSLREYDLNPDPPLIRDKGETRPNPRRVQCEKLYSKIFGTYRMTPNRLGMGTKASEIWKDKKIKFLPPPGTIYHSVSGKEPPETEYGRVLYNVHQHYGLDFEVRDSGGRPDYIEVSKTCPKPSVARPFYPHPDDDDKWSAIKAIEEISPESEHSRKPKPKNLPTPEQAMLQHALFLLCAPSTSFLKRKLHGKPGKYIIEGDREVPYMNRPGEGYVQRTSHNQWTNPVKGGWAVYRTGHDVIGPLRVDPEFCCSAKRMPGPAYKPSRQSRDIYVIKTREFANGSWGLEMTK
jgi:hypothetical protein